MKKLALAVAAVALGFVVWQLARGGGTAGAERLSPDAARSTEMQPASSAPQLEPEAVAPAAREVALQNSAAEAPVEALLSVLALSEPDPEGSLFEVVLEDGETPLPGALLSYLGMQAAASGGAEEIMAQGGGIDAVLDELGRHFRCDDMGQVRIGRIAVNAFARARGVLDGQRYIGFGKFGEGERRIVVGPEAGFEVVVVDESGASIEGAQVQLVQERLRGDVAVRMPMSRVLTDKDGRLFLANIVRQLGADGASMMDRPGRRLLVSLEGFFRERPEVEVDWKAERPEPIRLVRPTVGRVEVSVVSGTGAPLTDGRVLLVPVGSEPELRAEPPVNVLRERVESDAERAGWVVFENVEVGVPFDLLLSVDGLEYGGKREGLVVPEAEGSLSVELRSNSAVLVLSGRFVDEDGSPLASKEVFFGQRSSSNAETFRPIASVTTDAAGGFDADAAWADRQALVAYRAMPGEPVVSVDLLLPEELNPSAGGRVDLGVMTLSAPELLIRGRVVDERGGGLVVPLRLETQIPIEASQKPTIDARRKMRRWLTLSAGDGSFEFRGSTAVTTLILSARSTDYVGAPLVFVTKGQTDVLVELSQPGFFTFELPDLEPRLASRIRLKVTSDEVSVGTQMHLTTSGRSPPLPAGLHTWQFLLDSDQQRPLAEGQVAFSAGEEVDLGPITFTRQIYHYIFSVSVVGDADLNEVMVDAYREQVNFAGDLERVRPGMLTTLRHGRHELFTLVPIEHIDLSLGTQRQTYDAVEGESKLVFVVE